MRPTRISRRDLDVDGDLDTPAVIKATVKAELGDLAEVRLPDECDEPILAAPVRKAVFEWMTETRMKAELTAVGLKPRHTCLLYGPPGCGKTTLAHHFAARLGLPLIIANGEMIHSKYVGATGENVFRFFKLLRRLEGKVVGFFDELDSLGGARGRSDQAAGKEQNAIVTALLTNVENFSGLFFAATNTPDALDQALWRRFGMQIEVALPDFEERYAIIKRYFAPFEVDGSTLDELALLTRHAAPSLLRQLVEGLKRALVLGPKLKRDTSDLVELVRLVTTQVAPHPDYLKPPHTPPLLWDGAEDHTVALAGKPWPPERRSPVHATVDPDERKSA